MRKSSTQKVLHKQSRRELERFLTHLANVERVSPACGQNLNGQFPGYLPVFSMQSQKAKFFSERLLQIRHESLKLHIGGLPENELSEMAKPSEDEIFGQLVLFLSKSAQEAWIAPDAEVREWKTFVLRVKLWGLMMPDHIGGWEQNLSSDPPLLPLDRALHHLQTKGRLARHCANDDCAYPYFFATRKNQKFCRVECAAPSKREAKRIWAERSRAELKKLKREKGKRHGTAKTR